MPIDLEIAARRVMLRVAEPILPVLGKVQVPAWIAPRLLDKVDAESFMNSRPYAGTVLASRKRLQASNLVNLGTWKHIAMYVGYFRKTPMIIEAVWPWVRLVPVEHWFCGEDYAMSVVPTFVTTDDMDEACDHSIWLAGLGYDRMFEFAKALTANKAFYCAEVPWWCYSKVFESRGLECPFTPRQTLGLETVTPDDYIRATDKWRPTWVSDTAKWAGMDHLPRLAAAG